MTNLAFLRIRSPRAVEAAHMFAQQTTCALTTAGNTMSLAAARIKPGTDRDARGTVSSVSGLAWHLYLPCDTRRNNQRLTGDHIHNSVFQCSADKYCCADGPTCNCTTGINAHTILKTFCLRMLILSGPLPPSTRLL